MSALDHARDKRKGGPKPTPPATPIKTPAKLLASKNGGSGVASVPPYRPLPIHALPPAVRGYVESVANSVGCDPCFAALPALALIGAAIGGALTISPKRGWKEVPTLWAVVIGDSGTAKSPAADPVSAIAQGVEDSLEHQYEVAVAKFIDDATAYKARQNDGSGEKDPNDKRPIPPVREYFTADDVTIERLVEKLKGSPRGILLLQDELANWFGSFSRYKGKSGGSDAAKWLGMFDGRSVGYQRKTATPGTPRDIRVKRAIVSVSGGIQPGILANALSDESYLNSGLASRLVFGMPPKRCVRWSDIEPDPEAESRFRKVVHCLREMPFDPKQPVPSIRLDVMARAEFVRFHDAMAEAAEDRDGGGMAAAYPKLARVALRLAMIHYCATEADAGRDPAKGCVCEASMTAGIELAKWFEWEAERVYAVLAEKPEDRTARMLSEWVKRKGGRVRPRDLQRSNGNKYPNTESAELALDGLVSSGLGEWLDEPPSPNGGRPGRVFILGSRPSPDTRQNPTLDEASPPGGTEGVSDTPPDRDGKSAVLLEEYEGVSGFVGCRTGVLHEPATPHDPDTQPERVSDTSPPTKAKRRYQSNPNRGVDGLSARRVKSDRHEVA